MPRVVGGIVSLALHQLRVGDGICIGPRANGFFDAQRPDAEVLWRLATGTRYRSPYDPESNGGSRQKFRRVVSHAAELAYREASVCRKHTAVR